MSNMFYNNNQQHISIIKQCKGVTNKLPQQEKHLTQSYSILHWFPVKILMFFPSSHGFLHVPSISLGQILHFSPENSVFQASAAAQVMASDGLGGRVCIVSSDAGLISLPGYAVYSATKFGHRGAGFFRRGLHVFFFWGLKPCWSWFLMVSLTIWGTYTENRHTHTLVVYHHFHFFKDTNFLEFHMSTGRENPKTSPAAHPAEFNARILSWSISRAAATWSGSFCVLSRKLLHR